MKLNGTFDNTIIKSYDPETCVYYLFHERWGLLFKQLEIS